MMALGVAPVIVCGAHAANPITKLEGVGLASAEMARVASSEVQVAASRASPLAFFQWAIRDHRLVLHILTT